MKAKQYLSQHYYVQLRIEAHLRKMEELRELATSSGSFSYSADRVKVSLPESSGFENKIIKIADLDEDVRKDVRILREWRQKIVRLLSDLPEKEKTLMTLRYLEHMKWAEIAEVMKYEANTVMKMHTQILKELDEKYDFGVKK